MNKETVFQDLRQDGPRERDDVLPDRDQVRLTFALADPERRDDLAALPGDEAAERRGLPDFLVFPAVSDGHFHVVPEGEETLVLEDGSVGTRAGLDGPPGSPPMSRRPSSPSSARVPTRPGEASPGAEPSHKKFRVEHSGVFDDSMPPANVLTNTTTFTTSCQKNHYHHKNDFVLPFDHHQLVAVFRQPGWHDWGAITVFASEAREPCRTSPFGLERVSSRHWDDSGQTWRRGHRACLTCHFSVDRELDELFGHHSDTDTFDWHSDIVSIQPHNMNYETPPRREMARQLPLHSTVVKRADSSWCWIEVRHEWPVGPDAAGRILEANGTPITGFGMMSIFHRLDPHAVVLTAYGKTDIRDDMVFSGCYVTTVLLARSEGNDLRAHGWDGSSALPDRFVSEGYLEVARYAEAADHGVLNSTVDAAAADTPSAIPRKTKTDQDNNIWMESEEEGDDGSPNLLREQRRALQREIPWRRIDPKDRKAMADATVKEWSEWLRWNSVRQIPYLATRKIPKELILPSCLAYRWKPVHEPP